METALAWTGRVDVLLNNAGINIRKPVEEMTIEEWCLMMKVNTGSAFLGCKYAIPVMRRQGGGVIINTSSVCGLIGHRYTPEAYTASKGAVTMLTRAVASRYGKDGIRCNALYPSTVDTPFVQVLFQDPARKAERLGEVALGRLATVEDVAHAALFLGSREAAFPLRAPSRCLSPAIPTIRFVPPFAIRGSTSISVVPPPASPTLETARRTSRWTISR